VQVDQHILESIARINVHEPHFVEWLRNRLDKYRDDAIMQRDDIAVRIAQGRGQELKEIVELLDRASTLLRKA
jgi:hypothetical protein